VVDVQCEVEIARSREEIAAYACDPDNAMAWYQNIKAIEWKTPRPVAVGSQIAFVAEFLGRRLIYTYEVRELVPGECFVMSTAEGPFPMETTYTWEDSASGGTRMTLRNRGEPAGFANVAAPMMASAMRRANRKDLRRLKEILELPVPRGAAVPPALSAWAPRGMRDSTWTATAVRRAPCESLGCRRGLTWTDSVTPTREAWRKRNCRLFGMV
jgi:hypothetical protein